MNLFRNATIAALACGIAFATTTSAQQPGDLVLSSNGAEPGMFYSDFDTGSMSTISTTVVRCLYSNGTGVIYGMSGASPRIGSRSGPVNVTWANLPAGAYPTAIERDQDGKFLVTSLDNRVYKVGFNSLQTVTTIGASIAGISRDLDTGDFVMVSAGDGRVFRMNRDSNAITTIANLGPSSLTCVADMPGDYFAIGSLQATGLYLGNLSTGVRLPVPSVRAVRGVHESDTVWAATNNGEVYKIQGKTIVASKNYGGQFAFLGLDVVNSRQLFVTKAAGSHTVKLSLRFAKSKNQPYCAALSLGIRPGIPFAGNQTINLQADDLFFLTACKNVRGFTKGFVGTTGISGQASAEVLIPAGLPAFHFYATAAAVNPALIGDLELGNTVVIKVPASGP